jgi:CheY-like chemotaxis protein
MSNKLLLADDSITIRKVVAIIFANEDYALTVVDNGNAALEKAREIIPDIILADVQMPGNTGYEVCAKVRCDPALKHIPLLLLTGAFEPFDEDKARTSGADDFIFKPFESQQLIEKVKKLIALGRERKMSLPAHEPVVAAAPQLSPAPPPPLTPEVPVSGERGNVFLQKGEVAGESSFLKAQPPLTEETIEASPEDDLWDVFTLEEIAEGETDEIEAVLEEEVGEPFNEVETLEEFAFAEEDSTIFDAALEETGAASLEDADIFAHLGENTFISEEEPPSAEQDISKVLESADEPKEQAPFMSGFSSGDFDKSPGVPEVDLQFAPEEEYVPVISPESTQVMDGVFDFSFEAEEQTSAVPGFSEGSPATAPGVPEVELQFAPEEEYVPVITPVESAAAPVQTAAPETPSSPVHGEPALSEELLASIVAKISRDIIEKIAWEVVPDLAETLIREEIRKLKEGLRR